MNTPTPALLKLGVMATSRKTDEKRLPMHPSHLERIDADLRANMMLETGYGERFGIPDAELAPLVGAIASRDEIIAEADVIALPKPLASDLADLRDGQMLWGWPHCVQDREMTQFAIDKGLTLIAWEAMNHWKATAASACTSSTRTTRSPATARCCTPCSCAARPETTAAGSARW